MATEQFHYTSTEGKITLPHFKHVPFGVVRKLRKEDDDEALFALFEQVADAKALKVLDKLGMEEVADLFAKWQEASKVTVGESSASSGS